MNASLRGTQSDLISVSLLPQEEKMNTEIVHYDAALRELAQATRVNEVKKILDKAVALQVYARQAKERKLIIFATDIRLRAEIRAGDILLTMKKNQGAVSGKTGRKGKPVLDPRTKLSDLGITKTQSSRWQKLAALPKEKQEKRIADIKQKAEAAVAGPSDKDGETQRKRRKNVGATTTPGPDPQAPAASAQAAEPDPQARAGGRADDIGPTSKSEAERKDARLNELEAEVHHLQRENIALASEVEELKATKAELEAKIEKLEAENAKLRKQLGQAPAPASTDALN
jgi:hypothetical protein